MIASGNGSMQCDIPVSSTPALARPNNGTMPNITHGWMPCSSRFSGECASPWPSGMASAASTPAIVAWTPLASIASHSKAKPIR